jgi:hypothetical protein
MAPPSFVLLLGGQVIVTRPGSPNAGTACLDKAIVSSALSLSDSDRLRIVDALSRVQKAFSVDARLLLAVAEEESGLRSRPRSTRNAVITAFMQLQAHIARKFLDVAA